MGALPYGGRSDPQQEGSARRAPSLRYRCGVEHLHRLGARTTAEFLAEVARVHGIADDVLDRQGRWREALTPEMVEAASANVFPPHLGVTQGGGT